MSLNQDRTLFVDPRRTGFLSRLFERFGRPIIRPSNTVPTSLAGGRRPIRPVTRPRPTRDGISISPIARPRPIRTGFTPSGREERRGRRGIAKKPIKSPPIAFVRGRIPDVELTRRTGLTAAPLTRPRMNVSRRSRILTEPVPISLPNIAPAEIGSRRRLTPTEIAVARKASPKAVDPNLVRLRNRRTPRTPPVKKRLIGGGSFGGIRARGVGFTSGAEI